MSDSLVIYVNDFNAPKPNKPLTPGVCAVICNADGEILLHKRADMKNFWSLPGGMMNIGESVVQCCVREIHEEMGLEVEVEKLIGVYSSPECVFAWSDGSVYQSFVLAFSCAVSGNDISNVVLNNESDDYGWFKKDEIRNLSTLPYVKEIIEKSFSENPEAFFV